MNTNKLCAVVYLTIFLGCGNPTGRQDQSSAGAAIAPAKKQWTEVASWKGKGIKTTESFAVTNREWRLRWKTENPSIPGGRGPLAVCAR